MKFEGLGNGLSDSLLAAANAIVLESGDYKKFFQAALKKFGVTSPAELKGDKEKEFYDYIDKNWDGKDEKKEAKIEEVLPTPIDGVAESETFNEKAGKYAKYSDLLMQKARLVAQGPVATKEVGDINKKIASEIKKLGIKEDKGFERILMAVFEGQIEEGPRDKANTKLGKYRKPNYGHGMSAAQAAGARNRGEETEVVSEKVKKSKLKVDSKVFGALAKLEKSEKGMNDKEVAAIIGQLKKGIEVESDDGEPVYISKKGLDRWDKVWGKMDTFVRDEIYGILKTHDDDAMSAILTPYGA